MSTIAYKAFRYPAKRNSNNLIAVTIDNIGCHYYNSLSKAVFVANKLKKLGYNPKIMPNANPRKIFG